MLLRQILIYLFFYTSFLYAQLPPAYSVTSYNPKSKGYYFLNAASPIASATLSPSYNIILDQKGNLVYFKKFSTALKSTDFKLQANGLISYFSYKKFYLMDNSFSIKDSVMCQNAVKTDEHDLQVLKNGHYLILGSEDIVRNVSKHKIFNPNHCAGSPNATITCGVIQELDANKKVVFEWRSKNHFQFLDIDSFFIYGPKWIDWTHFNSVAQDYDGNILVSSRNLNEVTKINRRDSSIIWRLGGKNNQFRFKNDSAQFKGQHDVRPSRQGHITLFDNGREFPWHASSAKEYRLDEKNHHAVLVWNYTNNMADHSEHGLGNVQKKLNGNTVVSYGRCKTSEVIFSVFDQNGRKCFELNFIDTLRSYRVFNFQDFALGIKRPIIKKIMKEGKLYLDAGINNGPYLWSTGATTQMIEVSVQGIYFVCRQTNDGGYIVSQPYRVDFKE